MSSTDPSLDRRRVAPPHPSTQYVALDRSSADVWKRRSIDVLGDAPFIVRNVMNERVCIHRLEGPGYEPTFSRMLAPIAPTPPARIGCLVPGESLSIPLSSVRPGDRIMVTSLEGDLLMDTYELHANQRHLAVGTASYDPLPPTPGFYNLYTELSGINVYNHFRFPVDVYNGENQLLARRVQARVYVDNVRFGFHLGDWLTVRRSTDGRALFRFQIIDPLQKEVHLGLINPEDPMGGSQHSTLVAPPS